MGTKRRERGKRGRIPEGIWPRFIVSSVYCLNLDAIESNDSRLTAKTIFANIRERKRKKKRTKKRGGKKNSRERRSKGRSLTWMKFVFHPAASSSLSKGACSSMFLDATRLSWYIYIYICTPKISSLVRVRIIVFSSRLKSDLLRNS